MRRTYGRNTTPMLNLANALARPDLAQIYFYDYLSGRQSLQLLTLERITYALLCRTIDPAPLRTLGNELQRPVG